VVEAVGLVHPRFGALVRVGVEEALSLVAHQAFQKLAVVVFHLGFEVFEEELFGLLQSLPTLGRFNHEGFVGSHGCIAFHQVQGCYHCSKPRYTRSPRFYTTDFYASHLVW
jgi:hypothetical protein